MHPELLCGVDEAGRGPLCGSVVAAAVILNPDSPIEGLTDSKKLSEKRREHLALIIRERALSWAIAEATVEEIDKLNILHASMLAMKRAVEALSMRPDRVVVDGNRCPDIALPVTAMVKGDLLEPAISAASILAKTERDAQMRALDRDFPQYGLAGHKGYPTAAHLAAIRVHGIAPFYRKSFGPVRAIWENPSLFDE
ncbi:ribonuclease HII [Nitrogeniibacter aestuarii]|uniref:ribonuclease HII n=1 Tax=Nitrogeniibacter aestuarii TaxID=2815343 RepID=UPI001E3E9025|nr:ribonuclease HII [Nitrogeniibacter aestuarii]